MKKIIVVITAIVILVGCGNEQGSKNYTIKEIDGIKTFKNSSKSSKKDPLKPVKLFTISSDDVDSSRVLKMPLSVSIDSDNNIFVLDVLSSNIKKYDSNGNYLKSISKLGRGPGELFYPNGMSMIEDTLYVSNQNKNTMVKFDKDGNYCGDIIVKVSTPQLFRSVGKDRFIGYVRTFDNEKREMKFNLSILNKRFEIEKDMTKKVIGYDDRDVNVMDLVVPYAVSEKEVFVSGNSENRYLINVYSFDGKPLYNIEKAYKKVQISENELELFNQAMKAVGEGNPDSKMKYKKAINELFFDNMGRLWVRPSVDRTKDNNNDYIIDIFKDGVFIDRVIFDSFIGRDFFDPRSLTFVHDDKIYIFDMENGSLSVYNY